MKEHKIGSVTYSHPSVRLSVEDIKADDVSVKGIHIGPVEHKGFDVEIPLTRAGRIEKGIESVQEIVGKIKSTVNCVSEREVPEIVENEDHGDELQL